jgi:photosystem I P700 chlorophyll a apoprotein A2
LGLLGNLHDLESFSGLDNAHSLFTSIFCCHWGHLAVISLWVAGNVFHIGWNGNYELWLRNPLKLGQVSHGLWDPHFAAAALDSYSGSLSLTTTMAAVQDSFPGNYSVVLSYSGIYNWLYTVGFLTCEPLYYLVLLGQIASLVFLVLARLHYSVGESTLLWLWTAKSDDNRMLTSSVLVSSFDLSGIRLNFHTGVLIGFSSCYGAPSYFTLACLNNYS